MKIKMMVIIWVLVFSLSMAFAFKGDIFPNNKKGFFIQLQNIGYNWGNYEVKISPLNLLLSDYNVAFRYFLNKNSVTQLNLDYYDVNTILGYFGISSDGIRVGIWSSSIYNHTNFFMGPVSLKTQLSLGILGTNINSTTSSTNLVGYGLYTKDVIQLGYYIDNDKEIFTSIEGGKLLYMDILSNAGDHDYQSDIDSLQEESLYSIAKVGIKWYYTPYSIFEIGYRYPIKKSLLGYLQGNGLLDYFYNPAKLIPKDSENTGIKIPWITTDYYINFSMAF